MAMASTSSSPVVPLFLIFVAILGGLAIVAAVGVFARKQIEKTVSSFDEEIARLPRAVLSLMRSRVQ
jgi:hypothetical protein